VKQKKNYVLANQVHVDQLLSNISVKYQPQGLIASSVAPAVSVKKSHDLYRVYDRNFRIPETQRANRGEAREHYFDVSTASYLLTRHSLKAFVSDTDAENYDVADLRAETVEELTEKIYMRMELDVANLFTDTSWSLNVSLTAAQAFSANTTASNPIPVFQTGASTVIANSGMVPNFGILPRAGYISCVNHGSILDRLKYTSAEVDEGKLAALFDLPGGLLIPKAAYDTSNLGATTTVSSFYGANAWLGYKPDSPGPLKASSMYMFRKDMPVVKRWRVEERESECIEVNIEYQAKIVASLSGYFIKNI
jgi:hypothetical protein